MGMIAKYVDALPDEARDRVLTAQGWRFGSYVDEAGDRCLVGHAADFQLRHCGVQFTRCPVPETLWSWDLLQDHRGGDYLPPVWEYFDRLCKRVGLDRAVQLVKARAARPNRLPLAAPSPVTEQVAG